MDANLMRSADNGSAVGGGPTLALGRSNGPDCQVSPIDGGEDPAVIDRGPADGDPLDRIARPIEADHAGGAARGGRAAVAFAAATRVGVYRPDDRSAPVPISRGPRAGHLVKVGRRTLEGHDMPGHRDAHAAVLRLRGERRVLFAGDAVFYGGRIARQHVHDRDVPRFGAGVARLAALKFMALLPGHGTTATAGGPDHVRPAVAVAAFASHIVPPPSNLT